MASLSVFVTFLVLMLQSVSGTELRGTKASSGSFFDQLCASDPSELIIEDCESSPKSRLGKCMDCGEKDKDCNRLHDVGSVFSKILAMNQWGTNASNRSKRPYLLSRLKCDCVLNSRSGIGNLEQTSPDEKKAELQLALTNSYLKSVEGFAMGLMRDEALILSSLKTDKEKAKISKDFLCFSGERPFFNDLTKFMKVTIRKRATKYLYKDAPKQKIAKMIEKLNRPIVDSNNKTILDSSGKSCITRKELSYIRDAQGPDIGKVFSEMGDLSKRVEGGPLARQALLKSFVEARVKVGHGRFARLLSDPVYLSNAHEAWDKMGKPPSIAFDHLVRSKSDIFPKKKVRKYGYMIAHQLVVHRKRCQTLVKDLVELKRSRFSPKISLFIEDVTLADGRDTEENREFLARQYCEKKPRPKATLDTLPIDNKILDISDIGECLKGKNPRLMRELRDLRDALASSKNKTLSKRMHAKLESVRDMLDDYRIKAIRGVASDKRKRKTEKRCSMASALITEINEIGTKNSLSGKSKKKLKKASTELINAQKLLSLRRHEYSEKHEKALEKCEGKIAAYLCRDPQNLYKQFLDRTKETKDSRPVKSIVVEWIRQEKNRAIESHEELLAKCETENPFAKLNDEVVSNLVERAQKYNPSRNLRYNPKEEYLSEVASKDVLKTLDQVSHLGAREFAEAFPTTPKKGMSKALPSPAELGNYIKRNIKGIDTSATKIAASATISSKTTESKSEANKEAVITTDMSSIGTGNFDTSGGVDSKTALKDPTIVNKQTPSKNTDQSLDQTGESRSIASSNDNKAKILGESGSDRTAAVDPKDPSPSSVGKVESGSGSSSPGDSVGSVGGPARSSASLPNFPSAIANSSPVSLPKWVDSYVAANSANSDRSDQNRFTNFARQSVDNPGNTPSAGVVSAQRKDGPYIGLSEYNKLLSEFEKEGFSIQDAKELDRQGGQDATELRKMAKDERYKSPEVDLKKLQDISKLRPLERLSELTKILKDRPANGRASIVEPKTGKQKIIKIDEYKVVEGELVAVVKSTIKGEDKSGADGSEQTRVDVETIMKEIPVKKLLDDGFRLDLGFLPTEAEIKKGHTINQVSISRYSESPDLSSEEVVSKYNAYPYIRKLSKAHQLNLYQKMLTEVAKSIQSPDK